MNVTPRVPALASAVLIISLGALAGDLLVAGAALEHALLLGLVCLLAGLTTWRLLPRAWLAPAAAAVAALWSLSYQAPVLVLVIALAVPAAALLLPSDRRLAAPLVALLAGAGVYLLLDGLQGPIVAALAGGLATLLRPERPTNEQITFLRLTSLFAPGGLLLALGAANAATGYAGELAIREVLALGLGLAGLAALLSIAGLGLSTLLESADATQRHAWVALAAGLAVPLGVATTFDPSRVLASAPAAAVPIALLASTTAARLHQESPWPLLACLGPVALALALQAGL